MKKAIRHFLSILLVSNAGLIAQPQYDGALERYEMKSNQSVREGLVGEYYSGSNFERLVKVRRDTAIFFDWNYKKPIEELEAEYFSIRWRGKVYAEKGGRYVFTLYTDDGMRLWLNGKLILNAWKDQPPRIYKKRVILEKDAFYDIRIDYYQKQYQTTAAVFFNHEDDEMEPLNASNTIFGRNLPNENSKFDFWEEKPLMDQFWSWMGLIEEEEAIIEKDQSFQKVVPKQEELYASTVNQIDPQVNDSPKKVIIEKSMKTYSEQEEESVEVIIEEDQNSFENLVWGETLELDHIYFDQGKAFLRPESYNELDKLYATMAHHKEWKIKIDGHTDNIGYAALNLELSFDRARAVYNYLINKGIEKSRLSFEGFGSRKPKQANNTELNRQKNRRVEVTLVKN